MTRQHAVLGERNKRWPSEFHQQCDLSKVSAKQETMTHLRQKLQCCSHSFFAKTTGNSFKALKTTYPCRRTGLDIPHPCCWTQQHSPGEGGRCCQSTSAVLQTKTFQRGQSNSLPSQHWTPSTLFPHPFSSWWQASVNLQLLLLTWPHCKLTALTTFAGS